MCTLAFRLQSYDNVLAVYSLKLLKVLILGNLWHTTTDIYNFIDHLH